jgi:prepilin-type processing-associated H-X9-DG protein
MRHRRLVFINGSSLIELLIVLSIIGMLLQLLFPAIQRTRETARRINCSNNLRQLGLGCNNYASAKAKFPPGYCMKPRHNFVQYILPYIEEQSIYDKYDFKLDWNAGINKETTKAEVAILRCVTAPREYPYTSDYAVYMQMADKLMKRMLKEKLIRERNDTTGLLRELPVSPAKITDGLSHTVLLCETAGRPDKYVLDQFKQANVIKGARWATPIGRFEIDHRCDGSKIGRGSQLMNCTTNNEIYSFHSEGSNFAFGDGAVKMIFKDVDPDVLLADLTASAGD